MSESEEKPDRGFTIIDRRSSQGESDEGSAQEADAPKPATDLPRVDFATFVLSLGTSALYHLGAVGDPETQETGAPNLLLARETIETLEMLEQKTAGNLDAEESKLLENLLYEVRMRFVEASK